jgi:hypothetical protein
VGYKISRTPKRLLQEVANNIKNTNDIKYKGNKYQAARKAITAAKIRYTKENNYVNEKHEEI